VSIVVRRAEPGDYAAVSAVYAGANAIQGTLQLPFPSLERWRKRLAEPDDGLYSIVACVDTDVVGQLSVHSFPHSPRRRHVGQLGMAVRDDWQGKGAGTALMQAAIDLADKWLNLERLELEVYTDNEPAVRLYTKFGFVIEGTLVRFAFRDGRYADVYAMARLR
jgi:L-phenylalanine/L-methionine N-acetyltransferase